MCIDAYMFACLLEFIRAGVLLYIHKFMRACEFTVVCVGVCLLMFLFYVVRGAGLV